MGRARFVDHTGRKARKSDAITWMMEQGYNRREAEKYWRTKRNPKTVERDKRRED